MIRVLELYSGIGGMHYALKEALPSAKVIQAVDISPVANKVYRHNFPDTPLLETGIEGLSVKQLDKLDVDLVMMSPPCQPFTRIGLQKDVDDPRTKSFLHFLSLLPELKKLPDILLENVKGFETSEACNRLQKTLEGCHYHYQGFLLSPKHLGIPNARLRYFMLAKVKKFHFSVQNKDGEIWNELPIDMSHAELEDETMAGNKISREVEETPPEKRLKENISESKSNPVKNENERTLEKSIYHYLDTNCPDTNDFQVPEDKLSRYIGVFDIVTEDSTNSTCFTKAYTQYAEGTGSILNIAIRRDKLDSYKNEPGNMKFRYFMPREVANLLGFPPNFAFPPSSTRKQRYRVLGNSLNVNVVSYLLKLLYLKSDTENS